MLTVADAQRPPSRDDVLDRASTYARRFGEHLQGIVAREHYVQTIRATNGGSRLESGTLGGEIAEERRLVSSLLLVHEAGTPWQLHRDVVSVDEKPVVDREDRLAQLRPGMDGLIIEEAPRRATFLPDVWESVPDPRRLLAHLKAKGGWPAEYWSHRIKVWRYTTEGVE